MEPRLIKILTAGAIKTADSVWWLADGLRDAGFAIESAGDRLADVGHFVLDRFAAFAERVER